MFGVAVGDTTRKLSSGLAVGTEVGDLVTSSKLIVESVGVGVAVAPIVVAVVAVAVMVAVARATTRVAVAAVRAVGDGSTGSTVAVATNVGTSVEVGPSTPVSAGVCVSAGGASVAMGAAADATGDTTSAADTSSACVTGPTVTLPVVPLPAGLLRIHNNNAITPANAASSPPMTSTNDTRFCRSSFDDCVTCP